MKIRECKRTWEIRVQGVKIVECMECKEIGKCRKNREIEVEGNHRVRECMMDNMEIRECMENKKI